MFEVVPQLSSFGYSPNVAFAEMAILGSNNQKITISGIASEGASDPSLSNLIDEQDLVQIPPTYLSNTYFDEIYFVRTAENYLHLQYPYEWTHPPLGKLIIAVWDRDFWLQPIWMANNGRVIRNVDDTRDLPHGQETAWKSWIGGFVPAFLLAFDFMHFTMGRMATADT